MIWYIPHIPEFILWLLLGVLEYVFKLCLWAEDKKAGYPRELNTIETFLRGAYSLTIQEIRTERVRIWEDIKNEI